MVAHEPLDVAVCLEPSLGSGASAHAFAATRSVTVDIVTEEHFEIRDLTSLASEIAAASNLIDGSLHVFCPHTTCGLIINEAEDGLHEDLGRMLDRVAARDAYWAHDDLGRRWQNLEDENRPNGHSHIRCMFVAQPSLVLPIEDGQLALGCWQRLLFVELDGSRHRKLVFRAWGSTAGAPGPSAEDDTVLRSVVLASADGSGQ